MSAQPDATLGAAMMQNLLADLARLLATPPPGPGGGVACRDRVRGVNPRSRPAR